MAQLERSPHFGGDLRRLTRIIGAASFSSCPPLLPMGWSANETATESERTRSRTSQSPNRAGAERTVAGWDDAVNALGGQSSTSNTSWDIFTETYVHDEVYILNDEDEPIYFYQWQQARLISIPQANSGG
jgi:hypothetical protein